MPPESASATNTICTACGLSNIPERRICKRCRAPLPTYAREHQQISRPPVFQWLLFVVYLLVISGGFILLGITAFNGGPTPNFESSGSPIYLRGGGIALLRLPNTIIPQQKVVIYDDGTATRGLNPSQPNKSTMIQLTPRERQELTQLRTAWCQQTLTFRPLAPGEPFYDLGFRCGASYDVKQERVPIDMLPAIFVQLLARLPPIADP